MLLSRRKKNTLPLLPLRNLVVFPGQIIPLLIERPYSKAALLTASQGNRRMVVCMQRNPNGVDFSEDDLHTVGTEVRIIQSLLLPHGKYRAQLEGVRRLSFKSITENDGVLLAEGKTLEPHEDESVDFLPLKRSLHDSFSKLVHLHPKLSSELLGAIDLELPASLYADRVVSSLKLEPKKQQFFLELDRVQARLEQALVLVSKELEVLDVEQQIAQRVRQQMDKNQKEYYLNEKLTAIQKELGQSEPDPEILAIQERLAADEFPTEVAQRLERELRRLSKMSELSAESGVIRSYLDWVVNTPWSLQAVLQDNIARTRQVLDGHHFGLKKVKVRILEQLAVQQLNPYGTASVICLVGPPGVGKTSFAKSIAEATGRPYIRQAMGGVKDESEIRGHRRTYIGAMPGKIIQSLRRSGHMNMLLCLDEIDKISSDRHHGDPAAALLEVLDPEQNHAFRDHYLDLDVDLSQILFICTANDKSAIPEALRDRLELIELPSYSEQEKIMIARQYLLPRAYVTVGLDESDVTITKSAVERIIRFHTKEAGVRQLNRLLLACLRKVALRKVESGPVAPVFVRSKNVDLLLGPPQFGKRLNVNEMRIGRVMGLGVNSSGGSVLDIEVSILNGTGQVSLTGRLGDTLKESVHAGLTCLRRQLKVDLDSRWLSEHDVHVHYPGPAAHADGPSAGLVMFLALWSSHHGISTPDDIAVTGEVSIHGWVYAVGGIREKILAAHREGLKRVIIPYQNKPQLDEIESTVLQELEVICIRSVQEALGIFYPNQKKSD